MKDLFTIWHDADKGAGEKGDPSGGKDKSAGGDQPPTYEEWYGGQTDEVKGLLEGHISGLKTALGSEREAKAKAEEDLRAVASKLEAGSEAQKEVLRLADENAAAGVKVGFYEDAQVAGVTNLKLAYHVAVAEDLFDKRGNVNFEKFKTSYPELFGKPPKTPPGDPGSGRGETITPSGGMNAFIRRGAGRET